MTSIRRILDEAIADIQADRHKNKIHEAVISGTQFIKVKDQLLLLESLHLRAQAEAIRNLNCTAVRNMCIQLFNVHLRDTPGCKYRDVPHWKEGEVIEAIEWCKLNSDEKAKDIGELPEYTGWVEEIDVGRLTVGQAVELASIVDDHRAATRIALADYLLLHAEKKFKEACEIDEKTPG